MKIAIFGQYYQQNSEDSVAILLDYLERKNVSVFIESNFYNLIDNQSDIGLKGFKTFLNLDHTFNMLVSIGGDGTILRAVTRVGDLGIPIVGINTGRLGFLATIQPEKITMAFDEIIAGNYKLSNRTLLSVTTEPTHNDLVEINYALNEIAVSRKNTTSMITVETHLNDEYLASYWSDGLIISTPTGSTGYSLSCGGPIITPEAGNIVLTPIAPHNLNVRPLVIPDDTKVQLKVDGREDHYLLSLDSRIVTLPNSAVVRIEKSNFKVKMIELTDESFIDTLRRKMLWAEDRRN
ncbi:NAD kinase [Ichthyenterobacterium sp. W332]|uniref:NAD kinase n=1 Tax=Microcosmobacter mediterraneus TaxID=3075607 RepID=A0ABU2YL65_9FLAO|nr:NAD kinase [Ichthyenterobacterium sp. W332]MDT0558905.1 NAD kinase [Ichthyenterobacterium sp. W332]